MGNFASLAQMSGGFQTSRIIMTAVELKVFDTLEKSGHSSGLAAKQVASELSCDTRATGLLLNSLVALQLLAKKDGLFSLTETSREFLVTSSPSYYGHMIGFDAGGWNDWGKLTESVRTGKSARKPNMFQDDPDLTERFIMGMHSIVSARGDAKAIANSIDMSGWKTLLDIGSGPGTYPLEFLKANPSMKATIMDLPGTIVVTRKVVANYDVKDRITLVEGDYNTDPLPTGFDAVFMSNIVHSEPTEQNEALMKKVFDALNPGGVAIIKDHILEEDATAPTFGALFSMVMLLFTRGRSYTRSEMTSWYEKAGFTNIREMKDAPQMASLMIGEKQK